MFIGGVSNVVEDYNKYDIIERIGSGAFSEVYLAIDKSTKSYFALKKIRIPNVDNGI